MAGSLKPVPSHSFKPSFKCRRAFCGSVSAIAAMNSRSAYSSQPRRIVSLTTSVLTIFVSRSTPMSCARRVSNTIGSPSHSGAQAPSLREIAARAGVSRLSVYHHFGSKAGLFDAVAAEAKTEITSDPEADLKAESKDDLKTKPSGENEKKD